MIVRVRVRARSWQAAKAEPAAVVRKGASLGGGGERDRRWGRPEKVGTAGTAAGRLGHRLVCGLGRGRMCVYAYAHAHVHIHACVNECVCCGYAWVDCTVALEPYMELK